ncbi:uridine kinase [Compostimonas suwonensis]|uniref:Uridine kinase n=2 Tax=Compostimonas suwonensis TaxID=1048394 RepID=A0A2M9BZL9_9MICO|nr:uridine kinase [Compostimonas suwonensis]
MIAAEEAAGTRSRTVPRAVSLTVLVDGPSGAGKSTLADRLVEAWPGAETPTLVRLDDIYPGWGGLAQAGRDVHDSLLLPRSRGLVGGWRRYDWAGGELAEWHTVDAAAPLIVEGCGVLTRANAGLGDIRVWIDADDVVRKERALARDAGAFDPWWDIWQEQFDEFVRLDDPRSSADIVLDGTSALDGTSPGDGGSEAGHGSTVVL